MPSSNSPRIIFLSGGTGYIGRQLSALLLERGHQVRALARAGSESKLPKSCSIVLGNALAQTSFMHAVPPADTYVHLIGVSHPNPSKAEQFRTIDLASVQAAVPAAVAAGVQHFVYVSVAQPAPTMRAYVQVRTECEALIRSAGLNATFVRPWYVLGPGHRWPYVLVPMYWLFEKIPATRATAQRLGLVTLQQMVRALVWAIENPAHSVRIVEVPQIRSTRID
ncbi:NAD(P)H-binding protein [candidate division KSB1 bacterium]|nr:NAD(P)H-binding protein [candidate division KSB1 bacterium]